MNESAKFSAEVHEREVRQAQENQGQYGSQRAAIDSIAGRCGTGGIPATGGHRVLRGSDGAAIGPARMADTGGSIEPLEVVALRFVVERPAIGSTGARGPRARGRMGPGGCRFVNDGLWANNPAGSQRRGKSWMTGWSWRPEPLLSFAGW